MKTDINYTFLSDASIRIDTLTLSPWPNFYVHGEHSNTDRLLAELFRSSDPFALLWRGKIPDDILETIERFPQCLWRGLLETSQLNPSKFRSLSTHCPALIALMAMHESELQTDRDLDRLQVYAQKRSNRLELFGLPTTHEAYRILAKLPVEDCYPVQVSQLTDAIRRPTKRKLLRHLKRISTETLCTLQLEEHLLNVDLLKMCPNEQFPDQCNSVAELVEEISQFRQTMGMSPAWPYRTSRMSLHQLIQVRNKLELELALGCDSRYCNFPDPPLEGIDSSKLKVEPLTSVRALFKEGNDMENCIVTYSKHTIYGTHYAYRMTYPERATILLVKRPDDWYPIEIRTQKNGYVSAETVDLVHTWVGTIQNAEEVPNDYPF